MAVVVGPVVCVMARRCVVRTRRSDTVATNGRSAALAKSGWVKYSCKWGCIVANTLRGSVDLSIRLAWRSANAQTTR